MPCCYVWRFQSGGDYMYLFREEKSGCFGFHYLVTYVLSVTICLLFLFVSVCYDYCSSRPRDYIDKKTNTYFMLNPAEQEFFLANKFQIANNRKFLLAKHSWARKFLCLYIWNCQLLLTFSYILTKKISCSSELSMKKVIYNLQFTIFQRNFPIRTPNNHMNCNVEKQGRYSDSVDIRVNLGHWLSLVHVRWYNNPSPFCSDNTHSFPINALEWNLVFVLPFSKSKFKHFPSLTFSYL